MIARVLVIFLGICGVALLIPGFLPKQIRDMFLELMSIRGVGLGGYFLTMALLLPAAYRLKTKNISHSVLSGLFVCLSVLLGISLLFELYLASHATSLWFIRLSYVFIVFWGLSYKPFYKALSKLKTHAKKLLWTGFPKWYWKVLFVLVCFFLLRRTAHMFLIHVAPFGDEISLWHTASKMIMNDGLYLTMKNYGYGHYTMGLPWLISFPARIWGAHHDAWLYAYSPFVMACFGMFIFEFAKSSFALLASTTIVFITFALNRDGAHLIAGSLYGEAICSLLLALIMSHAYLHWPYKFKDLSKPIELAGLGFFLGFCMLAKPPLSVLTPFVVLVLAIRVLQKTKPKKKRFKYAGLLLGTALGFHQLWKNGLRLIGKTPEYSIKIKDFIENGVDLMVPLKMLAGLFNWDTPQLAWTIGLLCGLLIIWLEKDRKLFKTAVVTLVLYWGFVLSLYATLWQKFGGASAGRYMLHAAIAVMLLVTLSSKKKLNFSLRQVFAAGR